MGARSLDQTKPDQTVESKKQFLFLLALLTGARIIYTGLFELSLDEAYYWVWANYPSLSYYDHPPMVAWMIWVTELFGDGERVVRLAAPLSFAGVTWFVYDIAEDISQSKKTGFMAALLLNILPIFSLGAFTITPDSPLLLFWGLALWSGYKLVDTQKGEWWYLTGIAFGLAALSKYTAAFIAPSLFLFLLAAPEQRHWLTRREPWLGFLLGMVIFSPVIIWNIDHNWISFGFQLTHGFKPHEWSLIKDFGEFWGLQIVALGLFTFFFIAAASFGMFTLYKKEEREDYLYLAIFSAPIILFFLVNSFRTSMEGNWPAIAYISAVIATPIWVNHYSERLEGFKLKIFNGAWYCALTVCAVLTIFIHLMIVDPFLDLPERREISRRVYGWSELGNESSKRLATMSKDTFVLANRFQTMSLLRYYTVKRTEAFMIDGAGRFPYFSDSSKLHGRDVLYVSETERVDLNKLSSHFEKIIPDGRYTITRHGETIRQFDFFKCYNYQGDLIHN